MLGDCAGVVAWGEYHHWTCRSGLHTLVFSLTVQVPTEIMETAKIGWTFESQRNKEISEQFVCTLPSNTCQTLTGELHIDEWKVHDKNTPVPGQERFEGLWKTTQGYNGLGRYEIHLTGDRQYDSYTYRDLHWKAG